MDHIFCLSRIWFLRSSTSRVFSLEQRARAEVDLPATVAVLCDVLHKASHIGSPGSRDAVRRRAAAIIEPDAAWLVERRASGTKASTAASGEKQRQRGPPGAVSAADGPESKRRRQIICAEAPSDGDGDCPTFSEGSFGEGFKMIAPGLPFSSVAVLSAEEALYLHRRVLPFLCRHRD